jgi:hypothetical protein
METQQETRDDLVLGPCEYEDELITADLTGTAGSVTDTTTYPVTSQKTNTEKVTIDGGSEQTVTFSENYDQAAVTDDTTYPCADQDGNTEKVTIDGGSEQTVTFAGETTTAAQVAPQMDAQLSGCKVEVVGGQVKITSDSKGSGSSVAIGTGTCDLSWGTPADENSAEDIARQLNEQLTGCYAEVSGGQVKITSDSSGPTSSVAIGTGTCDLTWDTAVAGTGQSATWPKGTVLARNTSTKKLSAYADGGSNGLDEPVAVLREALTFAASGDLSTRVIKAGPINKNKLSKLDDSSAIDTLVFDKLIKNTGIALRAVRDLSVSEIS